MVTGSLCYEAAKKFYTKSHPSALRHHARMVPGYKGFGAVVSSPTWPGVPRLEKVVEGLGVVVFETNDGICIMCKSLEKG